MDVDAATNAANLGSAENLVQINLGLDGTPQSEWTQDQMISYLQGLSSTIAANPTAFSNSTIDTATTIGSSNLNSLELQDPSFSWDDFGTDFENNVVAAGNSVAAVGTGTLSALQSLGQTIANVGNAAKNTSTLAQWALPAALVIAVILFSKSNSISANRSGVSWGR